MCLCVIVWTYWYILLCVSVYIDTFYTIHLPLHTSCQSSFHCVPIYVCLFVCVCVCVYVYVDIFCMMCLFLRALSHVITVPIPIRLPRQLLANSKKKLQISCVSLRRTGNSFLLLCAQSARYPAPPHKHTHTHASTQLHKSKLADSEEVSTAISIAFFAYTRTQTCTHTCMHMHTRMYTSHTHTRTHTHTHSHKHTLSLSLTHT